MKLLLQTTALIILSISNFSLFGQDEDAKIIVEITKEIDGKRKTFRGEYRNTDEMNADPKYQEFSGDKESFDIWSDGEQLNSFFHFEEFNDGNDNVFRLFDNDSTGNFLFHNFDGGVNGNSFDFQFDDFDTDEFSEELRKKLKNLGVEIEALLDQFSNDDLSKRIKIISMKSIKVSDVGNEFGKKGTVNENSLLVLNDLTFSPNPSKNGKIKVRFTTPDEGVLSLRVSDLQGKEIFVRNFDHFSGLYSETIDLSGQEEGIYLLEISLDKKRVTKKLVVE